MHPRKHANHKPKAKILIADSEGVFRLGLKRLFSVEDDLRVVAQAENWQQLVAMARTFRPDLALVQREIMSIGRKGIIDQVLGNSTTCKVVITAPQITVMERENLIREGVSGLVNRSAEPEVFVKSVRKVLNGEIIHRPEKSNGKDSVTAPKHTHSRPIDTLTPREKTIISCLTQGLRNRDIANHLTITEQTVKNHLRSIYDKIGVSDRLELVLYAIHQRLDLPPVNLYS